MEFDKIKVLGISASPRAIEMGKSLSDQMLSQLLHDVIKFGGEAKKIVLAQKIIAPCEGCYSAGIKNCTFPCVHEDDDTNEVLQEIINADAIAVASPVYWGAAWSELYKLLQKMTALENNRWDIFDEIGRDPLEGMPFAILASQLMEGATQMMSQISSAFISMGMFPVPYGLIFKHSLISKRGVSLGLRLIGERRFAHTEIDIRLAARNLVELPKLFKDAGYRFDDNANRETQW
jgi:multimeric flavodoxin WrbA